MQLFKLTDADGRSRNNTQWGEGVTVSASGDGAPELCTDTVIHAYKNPNLALLLNPIHGNYSAPRLWEAEGEIAAEDWDKVGCKSLTTIREIQLPWSADSARVSVQFAILCAEAVLANYENRYPDDRRPRTAIEAAKEYLNTKDAAHARAARAAARAAYAADKIDFCALADESVRLCGEMED